MKTKKFFYFAAVLLLTFTACDKDSSNDDNDDQGQGQGQGQGQEEQILFGEDNMQIGNGQQEFEIKEDHTLPKGTYLLKGWVYITNGASLTIEPGTVIKGDKETKAALIVEPGGKLYAEGNANEPIVMTSEMPKGERRPGDWGGLVICGRATNNKAAMIIEGGPRTTHGGNNDDDNSGVFSYIRVEFAGYPFKPDQEINGITFGSVGRGTKIDHLQVSYCNDDSYEWFGGTVNCKNLIAYNGWDDEFDTDNGFSGKLQYLLSIRDPKIADTSLSNGFESDNNSDGSTAQPYTTCTFSNVTFVGPRRDQNFLNTSDYINAGDINPNNGSNLGIFQSAMQIRRNSRLSCFNSVAIGYPVGLIIDNQRGTSQTWADEDMLKLKNMYFAGMGVLGADINKQPNGWTDQLSTDGSAITDPNLPSFSSTYFQREGSNNRNFASIDDLKLNSGKNFAPSAGSPLIGSADFNDDFLNDPFFNKVNYIGAFASDADADDWTKGWANFDPQQTDY